MRSLVGSWSNRLPVWNPRNDMDRCPSMYHQSPPGSRRTWGTRSAIGPVTLSVHRSGGSMMWESDEIIIVFGFMGRSFFGFGFSGFSGRRAATAS